MLIATQDNAEDLSTANLNNNGGDKPGQCPMRPIILRNTQESLVSFSDTLHHNAEKSHSSSCSQLVCLGSLMRQEVGNSQSVCRNKTMVWGEAEQFLTEYYNQLPKKLQTLYKRVRLDSVCKSILARGTYDQTGPELAYGAQLAWRNSSRCIGRISWTNLQLFDSREVKSNLEMFEAICQHITYATNGGILRPAITIFPPAKEDGKPMCRIWNSQYVLYAGYKLEDNSVLGDPANVTITDICIQLGWRPENKRSQFDVLPLVLQYGSEEPYFYRLPEDLILKVKIRHPEYPKLDSLGLEWYAVPAVSGMSLDCGGVVYPACGFNGWYMSTEIMRDLCDTGRYNKLKEIAECCGLDTNQSAAYWKDLASVILNIAIIHSFEEDGVTIADQHSAADSFMIHMSHEFKLRGGCPADWVWINPPIGGCLTQVHHQEMIDYKLKPSYDYQAPAWKGWKGTGKKAKRKITFKNVARSVKILAKFMNKAMSKRIGCTILYASETGTAEAYAYELQEIFNQAFNAKVYCMKDYDYTAIMYESMIIIVAATTGNGEPPQNGKFFVEITDAFISERSQNKSTSRLVRQDTFNNHAGVMYSVFGLGSNVYPHFCAFAHKANKAMGDLGCQQIIPIELGDAARNQEADFRSWSRKVFLQACKVFCMNSADWSTLQSLSEPGVDELIEQNKIVIAPGTEDQSISVKLSELHKQDVMDFNTEAVSTLSGKGASKEYILVKLRAQSGSIAYNPGDHIAVYPENPSSDVDLICMRAELPEGINGDKTICLSSLHGKEWKLSGKIPEASLRSLLSHYLDITSPPSQQFLKHLANLPDQERIEELISMGENNDEYEARIINQHLTLCDILQYYPSLKLPAVLLLTQLHHIKPRYYSISSSPLTYPTQVHITATVVKYTTKLDDGGREHEGLCTNWMKNLKTGQTVRAYLKKAPDFHLPLKASTPVILIGPGSGIAPFRSFWQHKAAEYKGKGLIPKKVGQIHLFFGCQTPLEQIHRAEIKDMCNQGIISGYHVAFSRQPGQPKRHVQDDLDRHRQQISHLINEQNGHIYVCGDARMAEDVTILLDEILAVKKPNGVKMNGYSAKSGIINGIIKKTDDVELNDSQNGDVHTLRSPAGLLKEEGRYHKDIYGVTGANKTAYQLEV